MVRPDFCKDRKVRVCVTGRMLAEIWWPFFRQGREERRYVVSYWDPRTETEKEKTYSPSLKEIIPVDIEMPNTAAIPAARRVGAGNASKQTAIHGNVSRVRVYRYHSPLSTHISQSTVFALLPNTSGSDPYPVWTPAVCLVHFSVLIVSRQRRWRLQ